MSIDIISAELDIRSALSMIDTLKDELFSGGDVQKMPAELVGVWAWLESITEEIKAAHGSILSAQEVKG